MALNSKAQSEPCARGGHDDRFSTAALGLVIFFDMLSMRMKVARNYEPSPRGHCTPSTPKEKKLF